MSHLQQVIQFGTVLKAHKNLREGLREEAQNVQQREAAKPEQVEESGLK